MLEEYILGQGQLQDALVVHLSQCISILSQVISVSGGDYSY
jgi:hypothetical protein